MRERLVAKPDAAALNDLGVWFADQKDYACSARVFATSLQTDPHQQDMPHIAFMFGASLYLSGDTADAIAALREAERLGYREIKLHLLLAAALERTQARDDAESEWRAALEIDPEYSDAVDKLSSDLVADSDWREIIELLSAPRLVTQRTVQQCRNLGLAYAKTGRIEESIRVLYDGLNTYPDSRSIADQLAEALTQSGRRDEAEMVLQLADARQHGEGNSQRR